MLKIKNVTKTFGKKIAVNNISLHLKKGEIYSLIGPNGSGKTTLIKMVTGLLQVDQGEIKINNINISKSPEEAKSNIGYIPDEPNVWSKITGEEFLHFVGTMFGIDEDARKKRIPKLLEIFDLNSLEKEYFEDLSRGNKQKFSILAALLHKPKLLLIDEPIVGLDPISIEIAKKEFQKFTKAGGTILIVTHTLSVAQEISDKIGVMKYGKLLAEGTFTELQKKAKLKKDSSLNDIYKALTQK